MLITLQFDGIYGLLMSLQMVDSRTKQWFTDNIINIFLGGGQTP